jgi:predicted NAD/FAD-dependent oxidoreductase
MRYPLPSRYHRNQLSYKYQEGIYLCGDYMESPSIQGAMVAGRKAAQAILGSRL